MAVDELSDHVLVGWYGLVQQRPLGDDANRPARPSADLGRVPGRDTQCAGPPTMNVGGDGAGHDVIPRQGLGDDADAGPVVARDSQPQFVILARGQRNFETADVAERAGSCDDGRGRDEPPLEQGGIDVRVALEVAGAIAGSLDSPVSMA